MNRKKYTILFLSSQRYIFLIWGFYSIVTNFSKFLTRVQNSDLFLTKWAVWLEFRPKSEISDQLKAMHSYLVWVARISKPYARKKNFWIILHRKNWCDQTMRLGMMDPLKGYHWLHCCLHQTFYRNWGFSSLWIQFYS